MRRGEGIKPNLFLIKHAVRLRGYNLQPKRWYMYRQGVVAICKKLEEGRGRRRRMLCDDDLLLLFILLKNILIN